MLETITISYNQDTWNSEAVMLDALVRADNAGCAMMNTHITWCNHQNKPVFLQGRSKHVENSILAIIAYNTSNENSFEFITKCLNMKKNSILAIIAYNTSKENLFWCITKCPNLKKTVFLQSLHTIIQKKISFEPSHITQCSIK